MALSVTRLGPCVGELAPGLCPTGWGELSSPVEYATPTRQYPAWLSRDILPPNHSAFKFPTFVTLLNSPLRTSSLSSSPFTLLGLLQHHLNS